MSAQPRAITDTDDVSRRLAELGLTADVLLDALQAGAAAAALITTDYPPNYGGLAFWGEAVRGLRVGLRDPGWRKDDSFNFSTVIRGDGAIAVAIARGDAATGNPEAQPSTQYSRGPLMQRAVERNGVLPFDDMPSDYGADEPPAPDTWLLLHNRQGNQLVSELSFPVAINSSGFVEGWGERIILGRIDLDPARLPVVDDAPVNPEVSVQRRA